VTSDSAPSVIKAIEVCFPRAARQHYLAHRMCNLAAKVSQDVWPEFKHGCKRLTTPFPASLLPASLPAASLYWAMQRSALLRRTSDDNTATG
jgi:transposase-like protein